MEPHRHAVEAVGDIDAREPDGEEADVGEDIDKAVDEAEGGVDDGSHVRPVDAEGEDEDEADDVEPDEGGLQVADVTAFDDKQACRAEVCP